MKTMMSVDEKHIRRVTDEQASELYQEGWKAIKLRLHHDSIHEDIKTVEKVRLAVGKGMTIMVLDYKKVFVMVN